MKKIQSAITAANSRTMNAVGQFELFASATDTGHQTGLINLKLSSKDKTRGFNQQKRKTKNT